MSIVRKTTAARKEKRLCESSQVREREKKLVSPYRWHTLQRMMCCCSRLLLYALCEGKYHRRFSYVACRGGKEKRGKDWREQERRELRVAGEKRRNRARVRRARAVVRGATAKKRKRKKKAKRSWTGKEGTGIRPHIHLSEFRGPGDWLKSSKKAVHTARMLSTRSELLRTVCTALKSLTVAPLAPTAWTRI